MKPTLKDEVITFKQHNNGIKSWWHNGRLHRIDGAALEFPGGRKSWYLHGKRINCVESQEEFEQYLKLKAFW